MATWTADTTHSEVQFKVKHLMINTVTGSFTNYTVTATTQGDSFNGASVEFTANVDSITTGMDMRDNHLKSDDFFNAEQYPTLTFISTDVTEEKGHLTVQGNLTIRSTTLPVTLKGEFGGTMVDFYGNTKAGFELETKISRTAFGLNWNGVTEAGGIVVSDDVRVLLNLQLQKAHQ
jgi:polyisoprenoid-binding protein YceI